MLVELRVDQNIEHVVQDRVQDQINGIRDLIDSVTK
jgi:hypothetical protein